MRLIVVMLFLFSFSFARDCNLEIGTNLAGPADWGSEWSFVDIMKYSRTWRTHNISWVSGGTNPWDTELIDSVLIDSNGYPLSIPVEIENAETLQVVSTVWANTKDLKQGVYTILYEGDGELDVWGDASIVESSPGRMEVLIEYEYNIWQLTIKRSDAADPVRNIRVLMPGTEETYHEQPWSQEWLDKLEPFTTLRFMDWMYTNNSTLEHWQDRAKRGDYTYTQVGVPYEIIIEISNMRQSDAWICVPHLADDQYIRKMAELFRDSLDPGLKLYVELSNENWNWLFDQTHYFFNHGDQNLEWPEIIVPFIQNCMDIFSEVFAGQMHRLIRVVGVQHSWQDVSNRIVFNMRPGSFDAFSPAAYFGLPGDSLDQLPGDAGVEDILRIGRWAMINESYLWTKQQKETIADSLNIPMIYYEGGQHFTPNPWGTQQWYNDLIMDDAQTHPGIYDLYIEWFDSLNSISGDKNSLLMNFSFISPKGDLYGSFGVLESQFEQFPPYDISAPKYQAILDYQCDANTDVSFQSDDPPENRKAILYKNYPNPVSIKTCFKFEIFETVQVKLDIFNLLGEKIVTLLDEKKQKGIHEIVWSPKKMPMGIYIYRLSADKATSQSGKFIILH